MAGARRRWCVVVVPGAAVVVVVAGRPGGRGGRVPVVAATVNETPVLFQWYSWLQPGLKIPIRPVWAFRASLAGTVQLVENERWAPAVKDWLSHACWNTFVPAEL